MFRVATSSGVTPGKTYEIQVPPGEYSLCVGQRGTDTGGVLAGPFNVSVRDRDLTLDINASQSIFSAPGVVSAQGAVRPADRPGASAAEVAQAASGVSLIGRALTSAPRPTPAGVSTAYLVAPESRGSPARLIATARVMPQSPTESAFEFWYVPPGRYELLVTLGGPPTGPGGPGRGGNPWAAFGRKSVDLLQDLKDVEITPGSAVDVAGFVILDGRPASPSGLRITLQPDPIAATISGFPAMVSQLQPSFNADGTFVIRGVMEGRYGIAVTPAQAAISVTDIRQGGTSIRDAGLRVGLVPTPGVEIVLTSTAAAPGGR
jgi:hypothetical protein